MFSTSKQGNPSRYFSFFFFLEERDFLWNFSSKSSVRCLPSTNTFLSPGPGQSASSRGHRGRGRGWAASASPQAAARAGALPLPLPLPRAASSRAHRGFRGTFVGKAPVLLRNTASSCPGGQEGSAARGGCAGAAAGNRPQPPGACSGEKSVCLSLALSPSPQENAATGGTALWFQRTTWWTHRWVECPVPDRPRDAFLTRLPTLRHSPLGEPGSYDGADTTDGPRRKRALVSSARLVAGSGASAPSPAPGRFGRRPSCGTWSPRRAVPRAAGVPEPAWLSREEQPCAGYWRASGARSSRGGGFQR